MSSIVAWGIGWAAAAAVMILAFDGRRHGWGQSATLALTVGGGASSIGFAAYRAALSWPSSAATLQRARREGFSWALAFGIAVLAFWFWVPVSDLARSLLAARAGANNVVTSPVHTPGLGGMTEPGVSEVHRSGSVQLSQVQVAFFVCVSLFGALGGFTSILSGSKWARDGLLPAVTSAFVWSIAGVLGSFCLFVGFYILAGLLAAVFKPAVTLGVILAAAVAGFAGGCLASGIAVPVHLGMTQRALEPDQPA